MDKHALKVLEFAKIKEELKKHTNSELTIPLIEKLKPNYDKAEIKQRQLEVSQAKEVLIREQAPPLGHVSDIRSILKNAEKGIVLSGEELFAVLTSLKTAYDVRKFFAELEDEEEIYQRIIQIALQLKEFKNLIANIEQTVDRNGNIKDSASKKLKNIRQNKRRLSSEIKNKLNSIINSNQYEKYIQETVVTIRNNRYTIPIKVEHKNNFPGIVHDQSASGQTVFIEPMAVVEKNNKLRQYNSEEEKEIHRILVELSDKIKYQINDLKATIKILAVIDFIFTKARYSLKIDASEPLLNTDGYSSLIKARHPLIEPDEVVPIDIQLGDQFNALIITGPNTGGKTVTLKTFGLLTIMAQAGLHIPALSGSEVSVYDTVYADIGDEQSIEQSLSTFSSHMTQIIKIIENADSDSLVLLDELGAGTDPIEGSALAMSILNYLLKQKVKMVATTHYSELKNYAYGHDNVENASVEFDVKTLRPTYRLQMGLPGRSNAFQIAKRLGLKEKVINDAADFLKQENIELNEIIKAAERDKQDYEDKKEEMESNRQKTAELKKEYQQKLKDLEERKEKELKEAYQQAERVIKEAEQEAKEVIQELKEQQQISDRKAEELKSGLRDKKKSLRSEQQDITKEPQQELPEVKLGDRVLIRELNKKGEVVELNQTKEEAAVQAGAMTLKIDLKKLEKIEKEPKKNKNKGSNIQQLKSNKQRNVSPKLDLRGLRALEAEKKLDKYLDNALLTNLNQAEIIHGKGTGALRNMVQQRLAKYSRNIEYRLGRPKEGGAGVTIVNFK